MNAQQEQLTKELVSSLPGFIGTESYTRLRYPFMKTVLLLTDGAKYMADTAKAYWLMDAIASYQIYPAVSAEPFQVWKLVVNEGRKATLTCTDGNFNPLSKMEIEFTDFPLPEITLYAEQSGYLGGRVIMLTSEY
ncbi:MAG: DUF6876 family protein [Chloroflexota bacterium]